MPQLIAAFIGPSIIGAIIGTVILVAGSTLLSMLLFGRPGTKSERTESALKNPTPPRNHTYGARRLYGAQRRYHIRNTSSGHSCTLQSRVPFACSRTSVST